MNQNELLDLADELAIDFPTASWNERYAIAAALYAELSTYACNWDATVACLAMPSRLERAE